MTSLQSSGVKQQLQPPFPLGDKRCEQSDYILGSSRVELQRLLWQCELLEPEARWLLSRIGVGPDWVSSTCWRRL